MVARVGQHHKTGTVSQRHKSKPVELPEGEKQRAKPPHETCPNCASYWKQIGSLSTMHREALEKAYEGSQALREFALLDEYLSRHNAPTVHPVSGHKLNLSGRVHALLSRYHREEKAVAAVA